MNTPRLILDIKNKYSELNPALKQIADYLIVNYEKVVKMGIHEVAQASAVSDASVTRFVKTLGFKSFKSFQLELAATIHTAAETETDQEEQGIKLGYGECLPGDSAEEICRKVFTNSIQMLSDSLTLADPEKVERVADMIINARNVIFFGVGRSQITAESGRLRLYRLGINSFCYSDPHEQVVSATLSNEQDVVIGISNYGRSRAVVDNIRRARENGAKTVGITSVKDSPLAKAVDYPLYTAFNYDMRLDSKSSYEPACENITQITLLDCIYMCVALKKEEECIDKFYKTVEELEKERI